MLRKVTSALLASTGLLIGLGAFGHSFMGRRALDEGLAPLPLDAHGQADPPRLVFLRRLHAGVRALVIWSAWQAMRSQRRALFASGLIGIFYLLTSVAALAWMREPFWSVFVALGGLALVLSGLLGFAPSGAHGTAGIDQPAA